MLGCLGCVLWGFLVKNKEMGVGVNVEGMGTGGCCFVLEWKFEWGCVGAHYLNMFKFYLVFK